MFGCFFLSLNFRHSSLVTLKYHVYLIPSLTSHHSIFFTLFVGPYLSPDAAFFFLFSSIPKLTEPSEKKKKKKKKKKKPKTDRTSERRRKKKKKRIANPEEEREKKKVKGAIEYCLWVLYVCLITILPLSYEL